MCTALDSTLQGPQYYEGGTAGSAIFILLAPQLGPLLQALTSSVLEKHRKAQLTWICAAQGFFGCRHFSKANDYLKKEGLPPVDWQIDPIT